MKKKETITEIIRRIIKEETTDMVYIVTGKTDQQSGMKFVFANKIKIAEISKSLEWQRPTNGSRIATKQRNETRINWNGEGLKKLFGDDLKITSKWSGGDFENGKTDYSKIRDIIEKLNDVAEKRELNIKFQ